MDMVEKVAKAINDAMLQHGDYIRKHGDAIIVRLKPDELARAAIAAMRDCTPAMLDAGAAAHPRGYGRETLLTDIIGTEWRAMIDAALEEK